MFDVKLMCNSAAQEYNTTLWRRCLEPLLTSRRPPAKARDQSNVVTCTDMLLSPTQPAHWAQIKTSQIDKGRLQRKTRHSLSFAGRLF